MAAKLAYTRAEAAEATGIGIKTIDRAIKAGDLATLPKPTVKGRRIAVVLIAADELRRWIAA